MYFGLLYFDNRFATSERQWIEAQVENAKQQAILSILKAQVSSDEAHIHRDIHSLRYVLVTLLQLLIMALSVSSFVPSALTIDITVTNVYSRNKDLSYTSPLMSVLFVFRRKGSELAGELSTLSQKVQAFVSEVCIHTILSLETYFCTLGCK